MVGTHSSPCGKDTIIVPIGSRTASSYVLWTSSLSVFLKILFTLLLVKFAILSPPQLDVFLALPKG